LQKLPASALAAVGVGWTCNRRARFFTAAGSAGETLIALRVAIGWEIVERREGEAALALLRRVIAMLWKLTH
jgi:hypothetical protein